ncbi:MAG: hypothetical protein K0Q43_1448 [Ramlibacter sp.]|nr:hypothetical protein [Ramlibacter sp.]
MLREQGLQWFNADSYARELVREAGMDIAEANACAWAHGKSRLEAAIANRSNHAFETTLGGTTISRLLEGASKTHSVVMLYCGLDSPELHIARVKMRVAHGGHHISDEKIRERWDASRLNLIKLLPRLSRLQLFNNSVSVEPGRDIPDPVLVLDVESGRVNCPDQHDAAAMNAVPPWARPIVEAAIRGSRA